MATSRLCSIPDCGKPVKCRGWCNNHYHRWLRNGSPGYVATTIPGEPWDYYRNVVLTFDRDDCLIWPYNRVAFGYGRLWQGGKLVYVHRLACEAVHGQPNGEATDVAHSCGNGHLGCVNPRHLRWATKAENNADKIKHGKSLKGGQNPKAKLTEDDVRKIKSLLGTETQIEIGKRFGVTNRLISEIARGKIWNHLFAEEGPS